MDSNIFKGKKFMAFLYAWTCMWAVLLAYVVFTYNFTTL